jgi:chitin disaccharide deacetylase
MYLGIDPIPQSVYKRSRTPAARKCLIINADDLGADEARNTGIFEGIAAGSITSCSLLPNGPALEDAVERIRSLKQTISWGIHLNLSEGKPLSSGLRLLTGPDGNFLEKASAQRLFIQCGNPKLVEEIRQEFTAQILLLRSLGLSIDHMDGHQHIHILPAVAKLTAEIAKEQAIPWVRIPEEPTDSYASAYFSSSEEEARFFSKHAENSRPLFSALEIYGIDNFRGLKLKGQLPASNWTEFLESLPRGFTELMVHPGHAADPRASNPFSGFSTIEREKELEALIDGRLKTALQKTGVELTAFPKQFMVGTPRTKKEKAE